VIDIAKITLMLLAILCAGGGIMGYVKAKSKPSLIAGVISAMLLAVCATVSCVSPDVTKPALWAGNIIALLLTVMFSVRYNKTRKFMPSGLMIILCMVSVVTVTMALLGG
jgi:uncharacterized membrane protein (UPF0136 family)